MSNTNSAACVLVQNTLADVSDTELADDTVAPDTGPTETTVVDMTKYKPYFRQVVLWLLIYALSVVTKQGIADVFMCLFLWGWLLYITEEVQCPWLCLQRA